ncbi:MAG: hypothetical protein WCD70_12910 [Alphaproteobacteria bacterium]
MIEGQALRISRDVTEQLFAKGICARAGADIARPRDIDADIISNGKGKVGGVRVSWKSSAGEVVYRGGDAAGLLREALGPDLASVKFVIGVRNQSTRFSGAYLVPQEGLAVEKLAVLVSNALKPSGLCI